MEAASKRELILPTHHSLSTYKKIPTIVTYKKFREFFGNEWAAVADGPLKYEEDLKVWQNLLLLCIKTTNKTLDKIAYVRVSSIFE